MISYNSIITFFYLPYPYIVPLTAGNLFLCISESPLLLFYLLVLFIFRFPI